jgi:hypothetical protein
LEAEAAAEVVVFAAAGGVAAHGGDGGGGGGGLPRHWRTGAERSQCNAVSGDTWCARRRRLALPSPIASCTSFWLCTLTRSLPSLFLSNSNPCPFF